MCMQLSINIGQDQFNVSSNILRMALLHPFIRMYKSLSWTQISVGLRLFPLKSMAGTNNYNFIHTDNLTLPVPKSTLERNL